MIKLKEILGHDNMPPRQRWDNPDDEMAIATKSAFTAWEYALNHGASPRLWAVIKGSPYEKMYIKKFGAQH